MVRNNPIGFTLPCHSKLVRRYNFTRGGYVITLSKFSLIDEDRWNFARRQLRIKHRLGSLEPRLARVWCHFWWLTSPNLRDRCLKWSFRRWRTAGKKTNSRPFPCSRRRGEMARCRPSDQRSKYPVGDILFSSARPWSSSVPAKETGILDDEFLERFVRFVGATFIEDVWRKKTRFASDV